MGTMTIMPKLHTKKPCKNKYLMWYLH